MTSNATSLTFAVFGDVEPKPEPDFRSFAAAIEAVNTMQDTMNIRFTASIGDIVHSGKIEHFRIVTDLLAELNTPFYTIMGNEELMAGKDTYLQYAAHWLRRSNVQPAGRFVVKEDDYTLLFISAEQNGITLDDAEAQWLTKQVTQHTTQPIVLFTHAPAPGVFPAAKKRAMQNDLLAPILQHPNVIVHFSGHTHFDLDTTQHYTLDEHNVHHVHVPGIARTKVGPTHTPRFRVVTLHPAEQRMVVQTYNIATQQFEKKHEIHAPYNAAPPREAASRAAQ